MATRIQVEPQDERIKIVFENVQSAETNTLFVTKEEAQRIANVLIVAVQVGIGTGEYEVVKVAGGDAINRHNSN